MIKLFKLFVIPFLIALSLFIVIRPIGAQISEYQQRLTEFLLTNNVEVGEELVDGQSQVYYTFEEIKKFISDGSLNSRQPSANGEYVVYIKNITGEGQVFSYHIPTGKTVQLTKTGPNQNPGVSREGKVVWEGWVYNPDGSGSWQIFVFDGTVIRQITQGDISLYPSIYKDYVLYTRKNNLGEWRSEVYSLIDNKAKVISFGPQNKNVKLIGDNISFSDGGVYPLKPSDLFIFDISGMDESIPDPLIDLNNEVQGDSANASELISETPTPSIVPTATSSASN